MNKYIKILGVWITIELCHYCYLLYLTNKYSCKQIEYFENNEESNNQLYIKKPNGLILNKNFNSILRENYESDKKSIFDLESIYNKISNYDFNSIVKKNFTFITPYSIILRSYYTSSFIYDLYYFWTKNFSTYITDNTILLESISKNPNAKLIIIHTGILGNIHIYKELIDLIEKLNLDFTIKIFVFRSSVSTFFWNNSDIDKHVDYMYEKISTNSSIILISHSFGAYILEYALKKYPIISSKVYKEILIQPANIMSMGLIFLSSTNYNFIRYFNFMNKFSSYKKHNFIFAWMIKSLVGKSTISSIKSINGIRTWPRNFKGYLIVSENDPLINNNHTHPSYQEIQYIFPNYKIIVNNEYHGCSEDKIKIIIDCIKD